MVKRFAVVEDLFSGYTVVYSLDTRETSVFCDRCKEWVFESVDTDGLNSLDLYEAVVEEHRKL